MVNFLKSNIHQQVPTEYKQKIYIGDVIEEKNKRTWITYARRKPGSRSHQKRSLKSKKWSINKETKSGKLNVLHPYHGFAFGQNAIDNYRLKIF